MTLSVGKPEHFDRHDTRTPDATQYRGLPFPFYEMSGTEFHSKEGNIYFLPARLQRPFWDRFSVSSLAIDLAVGVALSTIVIVAVPTIPSVFRLARRHGLKG